MGKPLVAVVGSVRHEISGSPAQEAAGREVCRALGQELARQGFGIVVYSSSSEFIEADVVQGFVEEAGDQHDLVEVRYPQRADSVVRFEQEASHPALFRRRADANGFWQSSFYRSLSNVDGLLLVGGGNSTLVTGHVALSYGNSNPGGRGLPRRVTRDLGATIP